MVWVNGSYFCTRGGRQGACDRRILASCAQGFYWRHAPYTGVVIDVGAHIGGFCIPASLQARKVVAYEANAANFGVLARNVRANRRRNVLLRHCAAGNGSGPAWIGDLETGSTTPSAVYPEGRSGVWVEGVSLQQILGRWPDVDLFKCDCEASEYDLFLGQPRDLVRRARRYVMELHWHPSHGKAELVRFFRDCGYNVSLSPSAAASATMVWFVRLDGEKP